MAITQAEILAANDADGAIVITGTVAVAPLSGAVAISLVPPATAIPTTQAWVDEGHYLYIYDNGRTLHRITDVTAADGLGNQTVTVEFPFDSSEFRSYERLDGTSFTNDLPTAGNEYSISITMNDLVRAIDATESSSGITTFSDGTPSGVLDNYWSVDNEGDVDDDSDGVGVMIPANTALVQEAGTVVGAPFRNLIFNKGVSDSAIIRFGRLHPGDTSDANGDYYTSGGVEILDEEGVTSTSDLLNGEVGHNVQFIKGYASLVNSTEFDGGAFQFLRMYATEGNAARETLQANMFIDFELRGNIGVRVAGNDSFIKNFTYQNGVWRGLNFRISDAARTLGQLAELKCRDSDGMFYQFWPVSGTETVIDGFDVATPNFDSSNEFRLVDNNGSGGGVKTLILKNFDVNKWNDLEALSTQVSFCNGGSSTDDRVIAARDLNVSVIDSNNTALDSDNDSKMFIFTPSSSTDADFEDLTYTDEITDGSGDFAEQLIHIRNFRNGGKRRFASTPASDSVIDIEYVSDTTPAKITTRARRFLTVTSQNDLYDGELPINVTNLMFDDPSHSDATFAAIDLYTELDTAQKMYDYSKRIVYDAPQTVSEEGDVDIFSGLDSNDILTPGQPSNVILSESAVTNADDPQNLVSYNSSSSTLTVRVDTDADGGVFNGGFDLAGTHNLSILNTISGYVNADKILLATGHNIVDESIIINTNHTVNGELTLPAGTYSIHGGAIVSGLTIKRATGETEDVNITLSNAVGAPNAVAQTGVNIIEEVSLTVNLPFDYDTAKSTFATAQSSDGISYSDATTTVDTSVADAPVFNIQIEAGSTAYLALIHDGIEPLRVSGTSGREVETTVMLDNRVDTTLDIDAAINADLKTVLGTGMASVINIGDSLQDIIIRFAGNSSAITLGADQSKRAVWEVMKTDNYVEAICEGNINSDYIDFNDFGIILEDYEETLFDKVSSSGIYSFRMEVIDQGGIDRSTSVDSNTTLTEIRFKDKAEVIILPTNVMEEVASIISTQIKPDLINLGLGVPLLNEDGDAFETTPNLPS